MSTNGGAAPGLLAEAVRAKAIGAPVLGIIGNAAHAYGYHLADPPGQDYSERGPLNTPTEPRYSCAIDIGADGWPGHRAFVADMFARCRAGTQPPDLAEFIGSPDGKKALYWAWTQGTRVEPYDGAGHTTWFHAAKFRSLARKDGNWLAGWGPNGKLTTGGPDMDQKQFATMLREDTTVRALLGEIVKSTRFAFAVTADGKGLTIGGALQKLYTTMPGLITSLAEVKAAVLAGNAADATRDAALEAALKAGGGNTDTAAVISAINAAADATRTAVLEQTNRQLAQLAAAAAAQANAYTAQAPAGDDEQPTG